MTGKFADNREEKCSISYFIRYSFHFAGIPICCIIWLFLSGFGVKYLQGKNLQSSADKYNLCTSVAVF